MSDARTPRLATLTLRICAAAILLSACDATQSTLTSPAYNSSPVSTPAPGTVNLRSDFRMDAYGQAAHY